MKSPIARRERERERERGERESCLRKIRKRNILYEKKINILLTNSATKIY
jgi:hypothetical protein